MSAARCLRLPDGTVLDPVEVAAVRKDGMFDGCRVYLTGGGDFLVKATQESVERALGIAATP